MEKELPIEAFESDNGELSVWGGSPLVSFRRSVDGVWRVGVPTAVEFMDDFSEIKDSARATKLFHEAKAATSSTAKKKARPTRYYQPEEGAAAVRHLLTDFDEEAIMLLLDKPKKLVAALRARVPKERERDRFSPDSQQSADAATADADSEMELIEMLKPFGAAGRRKLHAALMKVSPEFVTSLP